MNVFLIVCGEFGWNETCGVMDDGDHLFIIPLVLSGVDHQHRSFFDRKMDRPNMQVKFLVRNDKSKTLFYCKFANNMDL